MLKKLLTFFKDFTGVIRCPGKTLGTVMKEKKWIIMFLLMMVLIFLYSYMAFPVRMAQVEEQARLTGLVMDQQTSMYFSPSSYSRLMASLGAAFFLALKLAAGAFFLYLFFGIGGTEGTFSNYFSLVTYASIIDFILPGVVDFFSFIFKVNFDFIIRPALFFTHPANGTLNYYIFLRLDVFSIWYTIAIALGIAVFAGISLKRTMTVSFLYFLFKTAVLVAFSYILFHLLPKGTVGF